MKVTVLGSGTSTGIPEYRCDCETCRDARTPDSPNARTRPSIHLIVDGVHIQFDTGPNFLEQIDRCRIEQIDAVVYTHCHADHISGTNDLVMPCRKQSMDMRVYGPVETIGVLKKNFDYMFSQNTYQGGGVAHLLPIAVSSSFFVDGVELLPIEVKHGAVTTYGYRIGGLAYLPDVKEIGEESMDTLQDLDVLILDGLSFNPKHPTHQSVGQAVEISERVGSRSTFLTHLMHRIDHRFFQDQCKENGIDLPKSVNLAFDGQTIEVS